MPLRSLSEFEPEKNIIYLTISVPELDPTYKLEIAPTKITFSGHTTPPAATATASAVEPKTYEFELDLFGEVEELKRTLTGKNLSLVLKKTEATEEYWPRLTKEKAKLNYIKVRPAFFSLAQPGAESAGRRLGESPGLTLGFLFRRPTLASGRTRTSRRMRSPRRRHPPKA